MFALRQPVETRTEVTLLGLHEIGPHGELALADTGVERRAPGPSESAEALRVARVRLR
jgi:hypothetical protein